MGYPHTIETSMTELKKLLLARVQEVTQIAVDRVVWYLINQEGAKLEPADKQRLCEALGDVTTALGRHTMSVFELNGMELQEHLSQLFKRIEALDAVSVGLGGPSVHHVATTYQKKLAAEELAEA